MSDIKTIGFCPHCNHRAPLRLALVQNFVTVMEDEYLPRSEVDGTYWLAVCEVCSRVILYCGFGSTEDVETWDDSCRIWPPVGTLDRSVPETIRQIYAEAIAIKNAAPNAFAVQVRKALEALCRERGVAAGPLAKQLRQLVDQGHLPGVLAEASDLLRLVGNIGAHAGNEQVQTDQVDAIDHFFRTVVEYVYVAPDKLRRLREQLDERWTS